jgi:hypothetical protein
VIEIYKSYYAKKGIYACVLHLISCILKTNTKARSLAR